MSAMETSRRQPALAAVLRAQLRLILSRRPRGMWIGLTIVLAQIFAAASGGILFGITIQSDHNQITRVMYSKVADFAGDLGFAFDEGAAGLVVVAVAAFIWAFFWPFRVWREERPQRRSYHWAMPVDRRTHDLLRVGAGLALLPLLVAIFAALAAATAALFGHTEVFPTWGAQFWLGLFAGPLLIYLLVSIPVVGSKHPAAWLWGTLGTCAAVISLFQAAGLIALLKPPQVVLLGRFGLLTTLGHPILSEVAGWDSVAVWPWALSWLCWLLLAAAGVWLAATRRHRSI